VSVGWSDRVWKHTKASGSRLLVLLAIADNADEATGIAWPSVGYLSRKTRITERAVQRSIQWLHHAAELSIQPRSGSSNRYRLEVGRGDASDRGVKLTGVTLESPGGDAGDGGGVTLVTPRTVSRTVKEPSKKKETRRTRLPDVFPLTEELRNYAVGKGCKNPERTFEAFTTHYRGNGKTQLDWVATFRTWVLGAHGGPDWKACGCQPRAFPGQPAPGSGQAALDAKRAATDLRVAEDQKRYAENLRRLEAAR
jgi:hypothetical protein